MQPGYGPGRRVFEMRMPPVMFGLTTQLSTPVAIGFLLFIVCCLTRTFRSTLVSMIVTPLEWLQANIAIFWSYIQESMTCLVVTVLLVSMTPALLALMYTRESKNRCLMLLSSYFAAPQEAFIISYYSVLQFNDLLPL